VSSKTDTLAGELQAEVLGQAGSGGRDFKQANKSRRSTRLQLPASQLT
jgi:hypothetical protein